MNKVKKFLYSQKAAPYVFILPFVLTVILFWVFPIANGVLLSFQDVLKDKWVGMNNYKAKAGIKETSTDSPPLPNIYCRKLTGEI